MVDPKTALVEFERFANAWDIDIDPDADFGKLQRTITRVIESGAFVVDEEGNPVYMLRYPKGELAQVVFTVPGGDAILALDRFSDTEAGHKMQVYMANLTGQPEAIFGTMDGRDLNVVRAVATLFLTSA